MNFKQIYEGWKNKLAPDKALEKTIKAVSKYRTSICNNCEYHSKNHFTIRPDAHCTNCLCTLSAKTACLSCECPIKKWMPEEEILN